VPARRTSRPTIKQLVDIGKNFAGLQQKNSDKQRAGYCQTVWANSLDSKIHYFFGWSLDG
jgi:hypothetical protein